MRLECYILNATTDRLKEVYLNFLIKGVSKSNIFKKLLAMFNKNTHSVLHPHLRDPGVLNAFICVPDKNSVSSAELPYSYLDNAISASWTKFIFVTDSDVEIYVNCKSNAAGTNNIPIKLINFAAPVILPHVTHIINLCTCHNVFFYFMEDNNSKSHTEEI